MLGHKLLRVRPIKSLYELPFDQVCATILLFEQEAPELVEWDGSIFEVHSEVIRSVEDKTGLNPLHLAEACKEAAITNLNELVSRFIELEDLQQLLKVKFTDDEVKKIVAKRKDTWLVKREQERVAYALEVETRQARVKAAGAELQSIMIVDLNRLAEKHGIAQSLIEDELRSLMGWDDY